MTKVVVSLLISAVLLVGPAAAAELKIGVVDAEDILNKSPEFKRIEESLKKKSEELGRPLQQREQDFGKQVEEYQKQAQAGVIKEDARKRKEEEFKKKYEEIMKSKDDAARTFQQHYQREMTPLLKKLEQAVEAVANEEKLDLVLPKGIGVYVRNKNLDITEKVRSKFR
uniref:OmpH family outer membrane protein n=1 Tax=Desulfobacca acetoxidans TaxID=60893 RepID=A0A7V4G6K0_9BACT